MGRLILTGDVHGELLKRFSYRNDDRLRELTKDDTVMVLGDFGCPFGVNHPSYHAHFKSAEDYALTWMQDRNWGTTLALLGNHDDREAIAAMDRTVYQGQRFPHIGNIIYLDKPCVLILAGKRCLCIPGAKSHDIMYRKPHISWWPDEEIDIDAVKTLLAGTDRSFDMVLTHDIPAHNLTDFPPTEGEVFLESLIEQKQIIYKKWYHGHMHNQYCVRNRGVACLFEDIIDPNDPEW